MALDHLSSCAAHCELPVQQSRRKGVRGPVAALGLSAPGLREFAAFPNNVREGILMRQAGHHQKLAEILQMQTVVWRGALQRRKDLQRIEEKKIPQPVSTQGTIGMPPQLTTLSDQLASWNERIQHRKDSAKNKPHPLKPV